MYITTILDSQRFLTDEMTFNSRSVKVTANNVVLQRTHKFLLTFNRTMTLSPRFFDISTAVSR